MTAALLPGTPMGPRRHFCGFVTMIRPEGRFRVGYAGPWPPVVPEIFARIDDAAEERAREETAAGNP